MTDISKYLNILQGDNREGCKRMWNYFIEKCNTAKGSSHNHQYWEGGYFDHIKEIMDYAEILYNSMSKYRTLPFTLSDAILILFLHDIEKPIKYGTNLSVSHMSNHEIRDMLMKDYCISLSEYQLNGLNYKIGRAHV